MKGRRGKYRDGRVHLDPEQIDQLTGLPAVEARRVDRAEFAPAEVIETAGRTPEHPIRRHLREITEPELHPINLDPYPGTVDEVADEIARFVLELEDAGIANGVLHGVINRLNAEYAARSRVEPCRVGRCRHGRGHEGLHHDEHGEAWGA